MSLVFEESTHTYTLGGKRLPSVTEIVKRLDAEEYRFVSDDVMERAAILGRAVHRATELYDANDLDEDNLDQQIVPYLAAYKKFLAESGFRVSHAEQKVHHPSLFYAGTLDRAGTFEPAQANIRSIIDLKTTSKIMASVGPQLWGYSEAFKALNPTIKVISRHALQLRADGTYRLTKSYDDMGDFKCFLSLLNIYNWNLKHA